MPLLHFSGSGSPYMSRLLGLLIYAPLPKFYQLLYPMIVLKQERLSPNPQEHWVLSYQNSFGNLKVEK